MDVPYDPDRALIPTRHVKSTAVRRLGYDEDSQTVQVETMDGRVYQYFRVPKHEYDRLRNAPSIGHHYGGEFKRKFPACVKVRDPARLGRVGEKERLFNSPDSGQEAPVLGMIDGFGGTRCVRGRIRWPVHYFSST